MPRKRSKSPKHKTRPRSKSKKTKSRSKSKNRKYGGAYKVAFERSPPTKIENANKYNFPVNITINKWISKEGNNYYNPAILEDQSYLNKGPTVRNIEPSYEENVLFKYNGLERGCTITKQWRVGNVDNFKFRTANKIPKNEIIIKDLGLKTYEYDFPCFIAYNISKSYDNNLSMFFKVYKLVNTEGIETFYIYTIKGSVYKPSITGPITIIGHDKFLAQIESDITGIVSFLIGKNDLMYYDKPST